MQVLKEQNIEAQDKISVQSIEISKLECDLAQITKSSSIDVRKLETENSDVRNHAAKLEKQLLDSKLRSNELHSEVKSLANDLAKARDYQVEWFIFDII